MLEILALVFLTGRIGKIVENKGYKGRNYKILTVVLWFGGELLGLIIGAAMARSAGRASALYIEYAIAIEGALVGAAIAYCIAATLSTTTAPIAATEQPPVTITKGRLPAFVLPILWLLTNGFANVGWNVIYGLLNPEATQNQFAFANIIAGLGAGIIAGILQWFILILVLPDTDRRFLIWWIPVTTVSWLIIASINTLIGAMSPGVFLLISLLSGLILGVSQWFILKKYSQEATLWILANVVDWTLVWIVSMSSLMQNISNAYVFSFIFGVVGSLVSSVTLLFILRKYT